MKTLDTVQHYASIYASSWISTGWLCICRSIRKNLTAILVVFFLHGDFLSRVFVLSFRSIPLFIQVVDDNKQNLAFYFSKHPLDTLSLSSIFLVGAFMVPAA